MSIMAIENAERIIAMHGFEATRMSDGVRIAIPWCKIGMADDIEWIECRTYREVFIALGY